MATDKPDKTAAAAADGSGPSSHDTCGQFPADEVKATFDS